MKKTIYSSAAVACGFFVSAAEAVATNTKNTTNTTNLTATPTVIPPAKPHTHDDFPFYFNNPVVLIGSGIVVLIVLYIVGLAVKAHSLSPKDRQQENKIPNPERPNLVNSSDVEEEDTSSDPELGIEMNVLK